MFETSSVDCPLDQRKVYIPDGTTLRSMAPLFRSQEVDVIMAEVVGITTLESTMNVELEEQPLASVTVTV
jgi:hypothetical protein